MSHHMSLDAGAASSFDDTEVSSRGRWATIVAVVMVIVHFLVVFVILGWHYYVVPRAKFDFDNLGQPLSGSTIMVIHQSDFVVNYWYLFFGAGRERNWAMDGNRPRCDHHLYLSRVSGFRSFSDKALNFGINFVALVTSIVSRLATWVIKTEAAKRAGDDTIKPLQRIPADSVASAEIDFYYGGLIRTDWNS